MSSAFDTSWAVAPAVIGVRRLILNVRTPGDSPGSYGGRTDIWEMVHYMRPDMTEPFTVNWPRERRFTSVRVYDPPRPWKTPIRFEAPPLQVARYDQKEYWASYYKWLDTERVWDPAKELELEEFLAAVPADKIQSSRSW